MRKIVSIVLLLGLPLVARAGDASDILIPLHPPSKYAPGDFPRQIVLGSSPPRDHGLAVLIWSKERRVEEMVSLDGSVQRRTLRLRDQRIPEDDPEEERLAREQEMDCNLGEYEGGFDELEGSCNDGPMPEGWFDTSALTPVPSATGRVILGDRGLERLIEEAPGPAREGCRTQRLFLGKRAIITEPCLPEGAASNMVQVDYIGAESLAVAWNLRVSPKTGPPYERGHFVLVRLRDVSVEPVRGAGTRLTLLGRVDETLVVREKSREGRHPEELYSSMITIHADGSIKAYKEVTQSDDSDFRYGPVEWGSRLPYSEYEKWLAGRAIVPTSWMGTQKARGPAPIEIRSGERAAQVVLKQETMITRKLDDGFTEECAPTSVSVSLTPNRMGRVVFSDCIASAHDEEEHHDNTINWTDHSSSNGTRLLIRWRYSKGVPGFQGIYYNQERGQIASISWNSVPEVELLDAGAGASLPALRATLNAAQFRVTRQGKAKAKRKTTEIFATETAWPYALDLARTLGLPGDVVQPLTWASGTDIVVAAGA